MIGHTCSKYRECNIRETAGVRQLLEELILKISPYKVLRGPRFIL